MPCTCRSRPSDHHHAGHLARERRSVALSELDRRLEEKDLGDGKMRREFVLTVAAYEPGAREIPAVE